MQPLGQQTILITGATDGHGRALASELAAAGATILVHGRDEVRGQETLAEIRARTGNDQLHWLRADLASLEEVRGLAEQVLREHERLDALVNNAGIGTTSDGDRDRGRAATATSFASPSTTSPATCSRGCCCRCSSSPRRHGSSTSPPLVKRRSTSTT